MVHSMRAFGRGLHAGGIVVALAAPVYGQQSGWSTVVAPRVAIEIAGVSTDDDRAQLFLRLIRVVHSMPEGAEGSDRVRLRLSTSLSDIDTLQNIAARGSRSGLSLTLTKTREGRDLLADTVQAAGLRLRERSKAFVVEVDDDRDEAARRQRLADAGIDAVALAKALNAGETVSIQPDTIDLPLPLPPRAWADVVFEQPIPPRALFSAIIRDRKASLLYYGLCAVPPETREFMLGHPELLRKTYRDHAAALAAFGGSFKIVGGRVDVPGGGAARALWEALVGEPVTGLEAFFERVFGRDDGRLAYFYDAVAQLDGPRQQFALGGWLKDPAMRIDRLRSLYRAFVDVDAEWSQSALPFARPMYDPATLLQVVRVTAEGMLAPPALDRLWRMAFESSDIPGDPARAVRDLSEGGLLDAAGLTDVVVLGPSHRRRERFEAFAFGQRVFTSASQVNLGEVLVALRGFARFPALMLIAERLGTIEPATYGALVRGAQLIESVGDPLEQTALLAQFQGTLALIDRASRTGRLDTLVRRSLMTSFAAVTPAGSDGYGGRVAAWIESSLMPALAAGDSGGAQHGIEQQVLDTLADRESDQTQRFEWEGLGYIVSVADTDSRRIAAIRRKQGGNTLDAVLAIGRDTRALTAHDLTLDRLKERITRLRAHATTLSPARPWPAFAADAVPDVQKAIERAVKDLARIKKPQDLKKAARISEPVTTAVDYLLGEVLIALVYAPLMGDPANVLGGKADISHRHDFGLLSPATADARQRVPWLRPRTSAGGASVVGSVLGLDLGLARNALRRLVTDRVPELPRLNLNDRETFTVSAALANPRDVTDADVTRLARAVKEGRRHVADAGTDAAALDRLAVTARMSATRRHLLAWTAIHDRDHLAKLFSLGELFELGRSDDRFDRLDAFGLTAEPLTGCYCARFPEAGPWESYSGRPGTGQLAMRVPDLSLRLAELLDQLHVPALLFPAVLALATQDFIDEVPSTHADDWPAVVAQAGGLTRERVEDYIAALAAGGPLRPHTTPDQR